MTRRTASRLVVVVSLLATTATLISCASAKRGLAYDYYSASCPRASEIVRRAVIRAAMADPKVPAPLLRLFFHDCFVPGGITTSCGGCDASILLTNAGSEQEAVPNLTLTAFDLIERIKAELEVVCPGVVSCADVLALAARFGVAVAGGPDVKLPLGRRDTPHDARRENAERCLPDNHSNYTGLIQTFQAVGLSPQDVINLSGAHTIGQAHCSNIQDRLYDKAGHRKLDPTLNAAYAKGVLYPTCPSYISRTPKTVADIDRENQTAMDPITGVKFDNKYYVSLKRGKGLFASDEELFLDPRSRGVVKAYAASQRKFFAGFELSLKRMGNANVITGKKGIIRKVCFKNR